MVDDQNWVNKEFGNHVVTTSLKLWRNVPLASAADFNASLFGSLLVSIVFKQHQGTSFQKAAWNGSHFCQEKWTEFKPS